MRRSLFCLCLCLALVPARAAHCGEARTRAGVGFGAEYNDNVRETSNNRITDLITHVKPELELRREGGRVQGAVKYRGDYQFHVGGTDYDDYSHYLNATGSAELVENLLFATVEEDLQPVYRSARRGDVYAGDTTRDQVNRNRLTASSYVSLNPTDRFNMRLGYRFMDLRYSKNQDGRGRDSFFPESGDGDYDFNTNVSREHTAFSSFSHELTDRAVLLANFDVVRRTEEASSLDRQYGPGNEEDNDFYRYRGQLGGRYEIAEDFSVEALAGPACTVYDSGGTSLSPYVTASLTRRVGRSEFGLSAAMDFTDDPGSGENLRHTAYDITWRKNYERTTLSAGLGYHIYDGDTGESPRSNAWRPSANLAYELTERLRFTAGTSWDIAEESGTGSTWAYADAGFRYELSEGSWLGLTYRYKYADISESDYAFEEDPANEGSYSVNRIMLEIYFEM